MKISNSETMITNINDLDLNKTYSYADYLTWNFQERLEILKGKIFKIGLHPLIEEDQIKSPLFPELNFVLEEIFV